MFLSANLYGKLCGGGITSSYLQNAAIAADVNNTSKQVTCTVVFFSILSASVPFMQQNLLQ